MKKRELYKVDGDKITRLRRTCPKCGDGVFLAEHQDRLSCGSCGYTEFKGKKPLTPPSQAPEEQPTEQHPPEPASPAPSE